MLEAFSEATVPMLTALEMAVLVSCSPDTDRSRLKTLVNAGTLYRREVGARVVSAFDSIRTPADSGYGEWKQSLWKDTNTAERARKARTEMKRDVDDP